MTGLAHLAKTPKGPKGKGRKRRARQPIRPGQALGLMNQAVNVARQTAALNRPAVGRAPGTNAKSAALDYARTMSNPFEYGPVKLGFETIAPTNLASAYLRASFTTNADGTFSLFMSPYVTPIISVNTSGGSGTTWTTQSANNYSSFTGDFAQARLISGGLRVYVMTPATAADGVLMSGLLPEVSATYVQSTYTNATLVNLPQSVMSPGANGVAVTFRPTDVNSTMFSYSYVSSTTQVSTTPEGWMCPYIAGIGFPASVRVWYECVLNYECLPSLLGSIPATVDNTDKQSWGETLANYFPSFESLWGTVRTIVSDPVVVDATMAISEHYAPGVKTIRDALSSGKAAKRAHRAHPMLIEEIHDEL